MISVFFFTKENRSPCFQRHGLDYRPNSWEIFYSISFFSCANSLSSQLQLIHLNIFWRSRGINAPNIHGMIHPQKSIQMRNHHRQKMTLAYTLKGKVKKETASHCELKVCDLISDFRFWMLFPKGGKNLYSYPALPKGGWFLFMSCRWSAYYPSKWRKTNCFPLKRRHSESHWSLFWLNLKENRNNKKWTKPRIVNIIPNSMGICVYTYIYKYININRYLCMYIIYIYNVCLYLFFCFLGGTLHNLMTNNKQPWPLCHHGTPAFSDRRKSSNCGASWRAFSQASNPPHGSPEKVHPWEPPFFGKIHGHYSQTQKGFPVSFEWALVHKKGKRIDMLRANVSESFGKFNPKNQQKHTQTKIYYVFL